MPNCRYLPVLALALLVTPSLARAGDSTEGNRVMSYGSWPSPITAASIEEGSRSLFDLAFDGAYLYWAEGRPEEGGRITLVRWRPGGEPEDVLAEPWNVRTRVQEYGGRSYVVSDGTIWFSHFADQRLYRLRPGLKPEAITPQAALRYAACVLDSARERLLCVREDHRGEGEPRNELVALPLEGVSEGEVLYAGSDFVSAPSLSPGGERIAFVGWDHPNMPWDNTTLYSAGFDANGKLRDLRAHNPAGESVLDPQWDAQGRLHALSDREDWWTLYRVDGTTFERVETGLGEAELGGPAWQLGEHYYRFLPEGRIAARVTRHAVQQLYLLDPDAGDAEAVELGSAAVADMLPAAGRLYVINQPVDRPDELLALAPGGGRQQVIRRSRDESIDTAWTAPHEAVSFPTGGDAIAHGLYYPPTNPDVQAPDNEAPPLMILVHGGPTSIALPRYSLPRSYWTSRGFAILDLNYRGSTGYGRAYRQALYGEWGVADVEDAVAGARWLAGQGKADPERLIIRGGSAGGFTTLAALAFHDVFDAGASYFGVSDIEALARETHKFESRYLDQLIGPYPERKDLYVARSPIHHLEGFDVPLLLLQGLDDRVVPPNQSAMIFEALQERGVPTAYIAFAGEGHGFRKAENSIRAREAEYAFYARVFGFSPAEDLPPVEIIGLE